jgi:hypothetical protein
MNSRIGKLPSPAKLCLVPFGLMALLCCAWLIPARLNAWPGVVAHEWGTFTAVAGNSGGALEWRPLTASTDLPEFVEHFGAANFKSGLRGTIRMETPVLYFYSPRETKVSVRVKFSKGVISEWYPHADRVRPSGPLRNTNLSQLQADGSITWDEIALSPGLGGSFPSAAESNRYFAARATSSTPLRVKTSAGDQQEKFLFYRGVSAVPLPLSAKQTAEGQLLVKSLDEKEITAMILFERRGDRVGYRLMQSPTKETLLEPPVLNGNLDSLYAELEGILTEQGLYRDEAHAMIETWRDSWFEEGSRLIYIVTRSYVDEVLPLTIDPEPFKTVRVFVGRLEIVTPATVQEVQTALASNDQVTLSKFERFLEPILQVAREEHTELARERVTQK